MEYWFGHKKEWNTDKWYNMDEPWKPFAKLKKSDTQKSHIVWFHFCEMSKASQVAIVVKNLPANAEGASLVNKLSEYKENLVYMSNIFKSLLFCGSSIRRNFYQTI